MKTKINRMLTFTIISSLLVIGGGCAAPQSKIQSDQISSQVLGENESGLTEDLTVVQSETALQQTEVGEYDDKIDEINKYSAELANTLKTELIASAEVDYDNFLKSVKNSKAEYLYIGVGNTFYIEPETELPEDYDPSARPWFVGAATSGTYTDIYMDAMTQNLIYTVSTYIGEAKEGTIVLGADFVLEEEKDSAYAALESSQSSEASATSEFIEENSQGGSPVAPLSNEDQAVWADRLMTLEKELLPFENAQDMGEVLLNAQNKYDDTTAFYLATSDGRLIASNDFELPEGYDPRERPWYSQTVNVQGIYQSEPYFDRVEGVYIHSLFMELESAPEAGWVLGVDIKAY